MLGSPAAACRGRSGQRTCALQQYSRVKYRAQCSAVQQRRAGGAAICRVRAVYAGPHEVEGAQCCMAGRRLSCCSSAGGEACGHSWRERMQARSTVPSSRRSWDVRAVITSPCGLLPAPVLQDSFWLQAQGEACAFERLSVGYGPQKVECVRLRKGGARFCSCLHHQQYCMSQGQLLWA